MTTWIRRGDERDIDEEKRKAAYNKYFDDNSDESKVNTNLTVSNQHNKNHAAQRFNVSFSEEDSDKQIFFGDLVKNQSFANNGENNSDERV